MKKRQWDPKTKALIVLEGLKGKPVGEICAAHQISQTQYYKWRDQFLENITRPFEPSASAREVKLERENQKLLNLVGELTVELKKNKQALRTMPRGAYPKVAQRNEAILNRIRELKAEHPFWGYRRVWAHLRFVDHLEVNKKRIERFMRQDGLSARMGERLRARRTPQTTRRGTWTRSG